MRLFTKFAVLSLFLSLFASSQALAEQTVSFEVYSGLAYNFSTPLTITENGQEDITLTADWETESFQEAAYYGLRIGLWEDKNGWEIELIHHKLKLTNNPEEIDSLEITHGYNLFTINRAWELEMGYLHVGAGFVFTHPELVLRGKTREHDENGIIPDRDISGPTMQVSMGRRFPFSDSVYGVLEAKLTATYAKIDYEEGDITAPNIAIHLIFGLGFDYLMGEEE